MRPKMRSFATSVVLEGFYDAISYFFWTNDWFFKSSDVSKMT